MYVYNQLHLRLASSAVNSQVGIAATQAACSTLHSSMPSASSSSLPPTLFQPSVLLTSRERNLTPGPQVELHGDHMDHSV